MTTHNLAIVFGPTLFQTDGKDFKAGQVVEDLIRCYMEIFSVGLAKNGVGQWAGPDWVGFGVPLLQNRSSIRTRGNGSLYRRSLTYDRNGPCLSRLLVTTV